MLGYYSYLRRIRPYFFLTARPDYTILLLSLLTIIVFGVFGFRPLLSTTFFEYFEVQKGKAYEETLLQKIEALTKAKGNLSAIANRMGEIDATVPNGSSQSALIQELSLDAGRSGVELSALTFRERKTTGTIGNDVFELAASGEEANLIRFLQELEKGRLIKIDSWQVVLRRESFGRGMVVAVKGGAFFIP